MYNIINRVADFADIDTRRAMGFKPRRIHVPRLNIKIPKENKSGHLFSVEFESGIRLIFWPCKDLSYETKWIIHENTTSSLFRENGTIEISRNHWRVDSDRYTHPDFKTVQHSAHQEGSESRPGR